MEETNIRFEDLPEAVQWIKNKLTEIALKLISAFQLAIEHPFVDFRFQETNALSLFIIRNAVSARPCVYRLNCWVFR